MTADTLIRSTEESDLEELIFCWHSAFGDPPAMIREVLTQSALLPCGVAAVRGRKLCSAMYAFDDLHFCGMRVSYLYALGTLPETRGCGLAGLVTEALIRRCFDRGADAVCLSPADAGLARWYAERFGMTVLCGEKTEPVTLQPDPSVSCRAIPAEEYLALRSGPAELTLQLLQAQQVLLRYCGGAFFRVSSGGVSAAVCAEPAGSGVLIRELCCPASLRVPVLRAVAAAFGSSNLLLRHSAPLMLLPRRHTAVRDLPSPGFTLILD